jgi:hypothetical protein
MFECQQNNVILHLATNTASPNTDNGRCHTVLSHFAFRSRERKFELSVLCIHTKIAKGAINKEKHMNKINNSNNNAKRQNNYVKQFLCIIPIDPTEAKNDINNRNTLWIILIVIIKFVRVVIGGRVKYVIDCYSLLVYSK